MAGTITVWLMRSAASRATKASALNSATTTTQPATRHMAAITAIRPVTWLAGTASAERSPGPSRWQACQCSAECTMLRCVSIAPLGRPVVPEV